MEWRSRPRVASDARREETDLATRLRALQVEAAAARSGGGSHGRTSSAHCRRSAPPRVLLMDLKMLPAVNRDRRIGPHITLI